VRRLRITSLAVAASLALGACAGTSTSTGTAGTPSAAGATLAPIATPTTAAPSVATESSASAAPAASASPPAEVAEPVAVTIRDFSFQPDDVQVVVGQVVTWTNEDGEPHTVRSDDGSISSPIVGSTPFEWTAEGAPGTEIPYICSIHPSMKGRVTIAG